MKFLRTIINKIFKKEKLLSEYDLLDVELYIKERFYDRGYKLPIKKTIIKKAIIVDNEILNYSQEKIDCTIRAAIIPIFFLLKDIDKYKSGALLIDEVTFMKNLCEKYSCSQELLEKRLKEVHKLQKDKYRMKLLKDSYENKSKEIVVYLKAPKN